MFLKTKVAIKEFPYSIKNKVHFADTLSRRTYFWDTAVPCGSENSHNAVQLNPNEDKYYLFTPYTVQYVSASFLKLKSVFELCPFLLKILEIVVYVCGDVYLIVNIYLWIEDQYSGFEQ